jgi:hypothetical protein
VHPQPCVCRIQCILLCSVCAVYLPAVLHNACLLHTCSWGVAWVVCWEPASNPSTCCCDLLEQRYNLGSIKTSVDRSVFTHDVRSFRCPCKPRQINSNARCPSQPCCSCNLATPTLLPALQKHVCARTGQMRFCRLAMSRQLSCCSPRCRSATGAWPCRHTVATKWLPSWWQRTPRRQVRGAEHHATQVTAGSCCCNCPCCILSTN